MRKNPNGPIATKRTSSKKRHSLRDGLRQSSFLSQRLRPRQPGPDLESDYATQRYADLYDFSPTGYVSFDRSGRVAEINLTAVKMFGLARERIIGMPFAIFVCREDTELFLHHLLRCRCSADRVETEIRLKNTRREIIYAQLESIPIAASSSDGAVLFQTSIVDFTGRKRAEYQLAEQARLLDLTDDAIIVRDPKDKVIYWNKGAEKMYGYTVREAAGKITHDLLRTRHPESIDSILKKLHRAGNWSGELIHTRKNGQQINVFSRWSLDRGLAGRPAFILESNTDITARKKAEAALQRSNEKLELLVEQRTKALSTTNVELKNEIERRKGLEGEILSVSDREQQRLGQELHDGLCQHLTAVAFMARSIALRLKNHRVIEVGDIEKIAQLVNDAASDTRNLSRALHRLDVDAAGLANALQDLVDREIWKTPCRLEVQPSFHIDDDAAAAQLYRIAREAVINANKHAQAREIVVRLERSRREIVLHVIDDGAGLSDDPKLKQGLGLPIMNYRIQSIGGRLEIDSHNGRGTRLSCYLPDGTRQSAKLSAKENGQGLRSTARSTRAWKQVN